MDKQSGMPELVTMSREIKMLNYDCNTYITQDINTDRLAWLIW